MCSFCPTISLLTSRTLKITFISLIKPYKKTQKVVQQWKFAITLPSTKSWKPAPSRHEFLWPRRILAAPSSAYNPAWRSSIASPASSTRSPATLIGSRTLLLQIPGKTSSASRTHPWGARACWTGTRQRQCCDGMIWTCESASQAPASSHNHCIPERHSPTRPRRTSMSIGTGGLPVKCDSCCRRGSSISIAAGGWLARGARLQEGGPTRQLAWGCWGRWVWWRPSGGCSRAAPAGVRREDPLRLRWCPSACTKAQWCVKSDD